MISKMMRVLIYIVFILCCFRTLAEQSLDPRLSVFAPYLGTWQATFKTPSDKPPVVDVSRWERALNGKAIRTLHSINAGDYGGESLIFFDQQKQQLVFYYFTTADFYTTGWIEVLADNSFAAYEDVVGNADGITQVRSVSKLIANKMQVATSYLKNGEWTTPEQRAYSRSERSVIFR